MGKSSSPSPPPIQEAPAGPDPMEYLAPILMQMQNQMEAFGALAAQPPMFPEMPEISTVQNVDWEKKRAELREAAAKEQEKYAAGRKGLASTILTTALLGEDEETPELITARAAAPIAAGVLTG